MKKCANCGLENSDEMLSCPACNTDAFIGSSPEAVGHIISPEEQRFWERMTFRQFAVFFIRLQAIWMVFYAFIDGAYFLEYLVPGAHVTTHGKMLLFSAGLHVLAAFWCLRYADRLVSFFIKDLIPNPRSIPSAAPGSAEQGESVKP